MDLKKLFRVLVVGGSVAGCEESSSPNRAVSGDANSDATLDTDDGSVQVPPDAIAAEAEANDAALVPLDAISAEAQASDVSAHDSNPDQGSPLQPCFCAINPVCCVAHDGSPATVADGFRWLGALLMLSAAQVWRRRATTEREAARLFGDLAGDLNALGVGSTLVARARTAARDEMRHAVRCEALVARFDSGISKPEPPRRLRLGPADLTPALFASVALSCVTETLSTALLLEMRERAADELVRRTVHEILRDEVEHSRIGWTHLAIEARRGRSGWLAPYLPAMLTAAVRDDLGSSTDDSTENLAAYGDSAPT